jgi:hypothetical protein
MTVPGAHGHEIRVRLVTLGFMWSVRCPHRAHDLVGQLASSVPNSPTPLYVGVPDAIDVVGGDSHPCALLTSHARHRTLRVC